MTILEFVFNGIIFAVLVNAVAVILEYVVRDGARRVDDGGG